MTDFHLANRNDDVSQFRAFAKDVNSTISDLSTAGYRVYVMSMGDESWDAYWYANSYALPDSYVEMQGLNATTFHCMGNHAKNIQIAVFDANTLQFKRAIQWNAASGQVEVSGIAVDKRRNMVWMSDWSDSRYVYCYSLETGKYYTKMQCRPTPYWCQGLFIADNMILICFVLQSIWKI